jgi:tRNA pseudouridine38-40 synthase
MPRVKLVLEYDGTNYVGWQIQQNGVSVQGRLQVALEELIGQPVTVVAAGRTDAGVHARAQVVAFDSPVKLPMRAYWLGVNGLLPDDISVVSAEEVQAEFDPRRWSRGKRYVYLLSNRRSRSPHRRFTRWEIFMPLDVDAMRMAAPMLLGRHDFSAFRAADCQAHNALRELTRAEVSGSAGDEISFTFEGTAFLKHMVRNMVGTLVEVGRGRYPPGWVAEVLQGRNRSRAGPTAPPHGLFLDEVFYGDGPRSGIVGADRPKDVPGEG